MSYSDPTDFDKNKRDTMIRDEFFKRKERNGKEVMRELSKEFHLSEHTIDRIIYPRKST